MSRRKTRSASAREAEQQDPALLTNVESQTNVVPPPPPPPPPGASLNQPSSSSAANLAASLLPSHTTSASSASSSGDLIAAQFAHLFAIVGRLSSENEALKAQAEDHSSELEAHCSSIARLSAENEELRMNDEKQTRILDEIVKTLWPTEIEGEEEGSSVGTSSASSPLIDAHQQSLSPFETLPLKVFRRLSLFITRGELFALYGLSFSTLRAVARVFYSAFYLDFLCVPSDRIARFVLPRVTSPEERVSPLLLSPAILLDAQGFEPSHLDFLEDLQPTHLIDVLGLFFLSSPKTSFPLALTQWAPMLHLFNPRALHLSEDVNPPKEPFSYFFVDPDHLPFLELWTSLVMVFAMGPGSVPILQGTEDTSAFGSSRLPERGTRKPSFRSGRT